MSSLPEDPIGDEVYDIIFYVLVIGGFVGSASSDCVCRPIVVALFFAILVIVTIILIVRSRPRCCRKTRDLGDHDSDDSDAWWRDDEDSGDKKSQGEGESPEFSENEVSSSTASTSQSPSSHSSPSLPSNTFSTTTARVDDDDDEEDEIVDNPWGQSPSVDEFDVEKELERIERERELAMSFSPPGSGHSTRSRPISASEVNIGALPRSPGFRRLDHDDPFASSSPPSRSFTSGSSSSHWGSVRDHAYSTSSVSRPPVSSNSFSTSSSAWGSVRDHVNDRGYPTNSSSRSSTTATSNWSDMVRSKISTTTVPSYDSRVRKTRTTTGRRRRFDY